MRNTYIALQISLHFILSFSHEDYGRATSFSNLTSKLTGSSTGSKGYPPYQDGIPEEYIHQQNQTLPATERKANATFVILARNGDLNGIVSSVKQMGTLVNPLPHPQHTDLVPEDRFNKKFQYPYVFLNEQPFSDEFKQCV